MSGRWPPSLVLSSSLRASIVRSVRCACDRHSSDTHTPVTDTHNDVRQRQSKKEPLCACVCLCVCVRLYRCVQFFHCFVCPDGSCPHLVLAPQTRGSTTRSKTNANLVYFRLHIVGRNTVSFPGCLLTSSNVCLFVRLTTTGLARHFRFFSQIDRTS